MSAEQDAPIGKKLYDNVWLLLAVGIVLPTVLFTVWGLIEVMNVPYLPIVK